MLPWLRDEVARRTGRGRSGRRPARDRPSSTCSPTPAWRPSRPSRPGPGSPTSMRRARRSPGRAATRRCPGWPRRRSAGSSTTRSPSRGREVRRGRRYAGVVLDPPTYGHGPGSGAWQLERGPAGPARRLCRGPRARRLRAADGAHRGVRRRPPGDATSPPRHDGRRRSMEAGDLALATPDGRVLRLGAFARSRGAGMMTSCAPPPRPS